MAFYKKSLSVNDTILILYSRLLLEYKSLEYFCFMSAVFGKIQRIR